MSSSSAILKEIERLNNRVGAAPTCVSCGKRQTIIDIATQGAQESGAGMHSCQTCLALSVEDVAPDLFNS